MKKKRKVPAKTNRFRPGTTGACEAHDSALTSHLYQSHSCSAATMCVETKFLRLFRAVDLGDDIDGWQVCWLGGWDQCRVLFVVMVKRVTE